MLMSDCLGTDEIFTHVGDDGVVRHVNASAMVRASELAVRQDRADLVETDFDPDFVEFIKVKRGVEQWKIDRLCEPHLSMPCTGVWMPDGSCLTVDGHHRIVRNFDAGKKTYRLVIFQWEELPKYCIENIPPELSDALAVDTMEQRQLGPAGIWIPPSFGG